MGIQIGGFFLLILRYFSNVNLFVQCVSPSPSKASSLQTIIVVHFVYFPAMYFNITLLYI
jgi:hypothetical protein